LTIRNGHFTFQRIFIFMETEIAISEFKAHCLEVINKLQHKHQTVIITKRDKPVAKLLAFNDKAKKKSAMDLFKGKIKINGDIVKPIGEKWNCEK